MSMSEREIKELKRMFVTLSMYYGKELADPVIVMYVSDLQDLDFLSVTTALAKYRKNPKNRSMPLPADVRAMLEPEANDDDRARIAAAKILEAMSRFGSYRLEEAKMFLGELSWQVVKSMGGWENLCRSIDDGNKNIYMAQMRDLTKSLLVRGLPAESRPVPQLEMPRAQPILPMSEKGADETHEEPQGLGE